MAKKFSKPELSRQINGDLPTKTDPTPAEANKIRLDLATAEQYPAYSRATIQKFIKNRQVSVNGEVLTKPNALIEKDVKIALKLEQPQASSAKPQIIYEDADVVVLNKPAGMLTVSKGAFNPEETLEQYGYIVHRLDRDTSGVIIVAKTLSARKSLQKQFQDRKAHKTYHAIVVGHPKLEHAVINIPITRNLKHPTTFMPGKTGREAITEYRVIKQNAKYSLLELKPQTGRTHQLRVHLAHIGTPILGDKVYNPKSPKVSRMFLHATELEITLPHAGRQKFTSDIPKEFEDVV